MSIDPQLPQTDPSPQNSHSSSAGSNANQSSQANSFDHEPRGLNGSGIAHSSSSSGQAASTVRHAEGNVGKVSDGSVLTQSSPRLPGQSTLTATILVAIAVILVGFVLNNFWLGLAGSLVALIISLRVLWHSIHEAVLELLSEEQRTLTVALIGAIVSLIGLASFTGLWQRIGRSIQNWNWDAIGASGEVIGALGQILIAVLAVYVAWRQYVISKDLTIQQNLITQQQTIDSYFQGISELVLDSEGLLEDWPQERAIAEGRTAAILSSIDGAGKAKVLRFLSRSRLLSPLKRDRLLGRAILDGAGGYEEDRDYGVRVIDLGVMLAGANLAGTDLRWTDLSDANLIRANLSRCDLVKANLVRTILFESKLSGSDMMGVRLFYGKAATATPRSRSEVPNYETGAHTGAVIENADFSEVQRMSEEQRYYCCAWGGSQTRETIPGGCGDIPNLLGR